MNIWNDLLDEVKKNLPDEIECELKLMHSKSALTRFANSQIHQNVDEESAEIYLTIHKDSKTTTISPTIAKTWRASKLLPPDVPLPPPAGCEFCETLSGTLPRAAKKAEGKNVKKMH